MSGNGGKKRHIRFIVAIATTTRKKVFATIKDIEMIDNNFNFVVAKQFLGICQKKLLQLPVNTQVLLWQTLALYTEREEKLAVTPAAASIFPSRKRLATIKNKMGKHETNGTNAKVF